MSSWLREICKFWFVFISRMGNLASFSLDFRALGNIMKILWKPLLFPQFRKRFERAASAKMFDVKGTFIHSLYNVLSYLRVSEFIARLVNWVAQSTKRLRVTELHSELAMQYVQKTKTCIEFSMHISTLHDSFGWSLYNYCVLCFCGMEAIYSRQQSLLKSCSTKADEKPRWRMEWARIDHSNCCIKRLLSSNRSGCKIHLSIVCRRMWVCDVERSEISSLLLTAADVLGTRERKPPANLDDVPGGQCRICGYGCDGRTVEHREHGVGRRR